MCYRSKINKKTLFILTIIFKQKLILIPFGIKIIFVYNFEFFIGYSGQQFLLFVYVFLMYLISHLGSRNLNLICQPTLRCYISQVYHLP